MAVAHDFKTTEAEDGASPDEETEDEDDRPVPHPSRLRAITRLIRWRRRRWVSKLTARVLAINVLALLILVGGLLYLGQYEERLLQSEMQSLRTEALIFAGALAEGAVVGDFDEPQSLDPRLARNMIRRLYETTDTRTRLFALDGSLIADSRRLGGAGGVVEVAPLVMDYEENPWLREAFDTAYAWITNQMPETKRWPAYEEDATQQAQDYAPVQRALWGYVGQKVWSNPTGGQILGVAVPIQRLRAVLGAVMVTRDTARIDRTVQSLREDILRVFGIAAGITVLLSLYLAGSITRPIRRLAAAAEQVKRGHGRHQAIPDFTGRKDEIGELSGSLRDMTEALWNRMDAIERFAADVAHEIKNPLTSLRSAVETASRIEDREKQRRLMTIIVEDVARLDRLITDISDASRLDAELSRSETESVDIGKILEMLVELYRTTRQENGPVFALSLRKSHPLVAQGLEGRLVQVFRNLLTNAMSFSPPDGRISLRARRTDSWVEVVIEDEGPGIPQAKLDAIFNRFYTERPVGEKFGTHSGLGLSISKQIVDAHNGRIFAENREDGQGARFTVMIPTVQP